MLTRRHALSLAAVLAATVVTGAAAILGVVRAPSHPHAAPAAVVQSVQSAPVSFGEEAD